MRMRLTVVTGALALLLGATFWLEGAVGPTAGSDGTYALTSPRIDKTGALVVQESGGRYAETSMRQLAYTACNQGTGITPSGSLSTTSVIVLYNPAGNNLRYKVQRVSLGYVSGTLSSGTVYHCAIISTAQAAPSAGTLLVNTCLDVGSANVGTGVVRTGATVAAGVVALRPFCTLSPMLATSVLGTQAISEDVQGEFVVEPGASYHLQSVQAGAGTSPLISAAVSWTEEPLK